MTALARVSAASLMAALGAALLSACSAEPPQTETETPARPAPTLVTDPLGAHAPARAVTGELVAISQVMAPAGANGTVSGDVESQTGAALRVLSDQLESIGLSLADIAQLTVHVAAEPDGSLDTDAVARAWRRSFGNRMQPAAPARTIVGVAALPTPGARVSLTALAVRPGPASNTIETDTP